MATPGIPAQKANQKSTWNPGKPIYGCFCPFKKLLRILQITLWSHFCSCKL